MPAPLGMIKAGAVELAFLKPNISARDEAAGVGSGRKHHSAHLYHFFFRLASLNAHVYTSVSNAVEMHSRSITSRSFIDVLFDGAPQTK